MCSTTKSPVLIFALLKSYFAINTCISYVLHYNLLFFFNFSYLYTNGDYFRQERVTTDNDDDDDESVTDRGQADRSSTGWMWSVDCPTTCRRWPSVAEMIQDTSYTY